MTGSTFCRRCEIGVRQVQVSGLRGERPEEHSGKTPKGGGEGASGHGLLWRKTRLLKAQDYDAPQNLADVSRPCKTIALPQPSIVALSLAAGAFVLRWHEGPEKTNRQCHLFPGRSGKFLDGADFARNQFPKLG